LVEARREPVDAPVAAVAVDLLVGARVELDAPPVLDVAQAAPGRVALHVPLIARHAQLGRALLELDRLAAGEGRAVDELLGDLDRAVVVDADLGDDEDRLAAPDEAGPDSDLAHDGPPCGCARSDSSQSANSRKAPWPPAAAPTWWTAARTAGTASAGAPVRPAAPTRRSASRSLMSSPMKAIA